MKLTVVRVELEDLLDRLNCPKMTSETRAPPLVIMKTTLVSLREPGQPPDSPDDIPQGHRAIRSVTGDGSRKRSARERRGRKEITATNKLWGEKTTRARI